MFFFLVSHFALSGLGLALIAGCVALFFFAPLLLTNRYVLGAIVVAFGVLAALLGWSAVEDHYMELGAKRERVLQEASNAKHRAEIIAVNEGWRTKLADSTGAAALDLQLKETELEAEREARKHDRPKRVTPVADAGCTITDGFVRDHDGALPGPVGGAARVHLPEPADPNRRSGVPLSRVAEVVDDNYSTCDRLLQRVESAERRRYADCVEYDRTYGTASGCTREARPSTEAPH